MDLTSFEQIKEADDKDAGLQFMWWLGVIGKHHIRQGETGGKSELALSKLQLESLKQEYDIKLKPIGMSWDWVFQES